MENQIIIEAGAPASESLTAISQKAIVLTVATGIARAGAVVSGASSLWCLCLGLGNSPAIIAGLSAVGLKGLSATLSKDAEQTFCQLQGLHRRQQLFVCRSNLARKINPR